MTYSSYRNHTGTNIVTISEEDTIDLAAAEKHMIPVGANDGDFGKRYIFSDKGDSDRFQLFKFEVDAQYRNMGTA